MASSAGLLPHDDRYLKPPVISVPLIKTNTAAANHEQGSRFRAGDIEYVKVPVKKS